MLTFEDWRGASFTCAQCSWSGPGRQARLTALSAFDYFLRCPACDRILGAMKAPTLDEAREHWADLGDDMRAQIAELEQRRSDYGQRRLERPEQLPQLDDRALLLTWDLTSREGGDIVIRHGDHVVWREPAYYENYTRFEEIARVLTLKYGARLADLVPTETSELFLYGDRVSAPEYVRRIRERLRAGEGGPAAS